MMRASPLVCLVALGIVGGGAGGAGCAGPGPATPARTTPSRADTDGLAVGLGFGYETPILGGQFLYYVRLGERPLNVAPHAGVGWWPGGNHDGRAGVAAGALTTYGRKHRVIVDLSYGLAAVEHQTDLFGDGRHSNALYGASAAFGYEFMAHGGFFFRATTGGTFRTEEARFVENDDRTSSTLHVGFGYKLW